MAARGVIIGAPRSGAGKTTVTLAILAALRRRGVAVRAAKSGPDYIDPAFHAAATGAPGCNLDSWAMPPALLDALAAEAARDAELLVIESAMGLFDGIDAPPGRRGSAADLAARFRLPVLLVLDVSGQAQSAAAIARGFAAHDAETRVAGVILNRVASDRHCNSVARAMAELGLPVLGALPRDAAIALPERHLGLVQASEQDDLAARLNDLAERAERHFELDAIAALAASLQPPTRGPARLLPPPGQRIALAQDAAFGFVYPHVLRGWRQQGAEIVPFSPLADEAPPANCDACWLPGGYPELHAARLTAARRFREGLTRFGASHPVHGECGGYMVLGAGLEDADGARHEMAGLLSHSTSFARKRLHLGYRTARLMQDCALGSGGAAISGHEFHYASLLAAGDDAPLAVLSDGNGATLGSAGGQRGVVSGTFFHAIAVQDAGTEIP